MVPLSRHFGSRGLSCVILCELLLILYFFKDLCLSSLLSSEELIHRWCSEYSDSVSIIYEMYLKVLLRDRFLRENA